MKFPWKFPQIKRHHVHHASLYTAAVIAAVLFFVIGLGIRLLIGPVSLNPISGQLSQALTTALPGLTVKFDEAALEWSRKDNRINLVILGARVFDDRNRLIAQAPKAAVNLSARAFFKRKVVVKSIALIGVQMTLVREKGGALRLGLAGGAESDFLQKITNSLSAKNSGASALQSVAIRDARIAFLDEASGLFLVAPQANLQVSTGVPKSKNVEANVDAQLEVSGHQAHVVMAIELPPGDVPARGDFSITGFNLRALGTNAKFFNALKNVNLDVDVSGSFAFEHGTQLKMLDIGFKASGTINDSRMPGGAIHLKSATASVRYDGETGRLLLDDAALDADKFKAHAQGAGDVVVDKNGVLTQVRGDVTAENVMLDLPKFFAEQVLLPHVVMRAGYAPSSGEIDLERVAISGGTLSLDVAGKIILPAGKSPEIDVTGSIGALGVHDLIRYWPETAAPGARQWISDNISAGRVGPVAVATHIPAGALDGAELPEADVNLTFAMSGLTASYVDGLTPLTNAQGHAVLTGDTFKLFVTSAQVGALRVSKGQVVIAGLHVAGTPADITAHIDGSIPDVLALIDMKPLQYPTRFGIKRNGAKGNASIDASFKIPTIRNVSVDAAGINVKVNVTGLELAFGEHAQVSNGDVLLDIDNKSLHAAGLVSLYGSRVDMDWKEDFRAKGASTQISVKGTLDEAARAQLGIDTGQYLTGPLNLSANLLGSRGKIQSAVATIDLTPATLKINLINYVKPAGSPASAQVTARFAPDGAVDCQEIKLSGSGLSANGKADFDKNGNLTVLSLPLLHAGPGNDFGIDLTRSPTDGLDVTVHGRMLDGTGLAREDDTPSEKNEAAKPPSQEPFRITANLDRVLLRDSIALAPFSLSMRGVGDRPDTMSLAGTLNKGAKLTGSIATDAGGRRLTISVDNAGMLIDGLFNFNSIKGGALTANATLSPTDATAKGAKVDFQGTVVIKDFRVTNQPFLARLFAAGSLGGLIDLLGGQGIAIDKLQVPFKASNGVITIADARATGPSVGITAEGYIDRARDRISLGGTLAPIYGLNSVLGVLPILGTLLVSKPGEGVIGMTYNVSGNAYEPQISINPLSVLTPGIFRRIFEGAHVPPPQEQTQTNVKTETQTPADPQPAPQ